MWQLEFKKVKMKEVTNQEFKAWNFFSSEPFVRQSFPRGQTTSFTIPWIRHLEQRGKSPLYEAQPKNH